MLELISDTHPTLLTLVLVSVVSALAAVAFAFFSASKMQNTLAMLHTQLKTLDKQSQILASGSQGMGQRMVVLEKKLRSLQDTQADICHSDLEFSYTQAQKLIEQGMDAQTVAASSGLSASEVGLMQMLHQRMGHSVDIG